MEQLPFHFIWMTTFKENVPLARFSHYKIGGPARYFFAPKNEEEMAWAVGEAKKRHLPVFILGGGTNLLISDRGFKGLVLKPNLRELAAYGTTVTVGAGVLVSDLLRFAIKRSLSGLEWAGGLPGTVGGAIRGNAGCFGGEIKDSIVSVRSFDIKTMKIVERRAHACDFGYRTSVFKKRGDQEIILSADLRLKKGNARAIAKGIKEKIDYRKKNHPLEYPNIGSIFKNVPLAFIYKKGTAKHKEALLAHSLVFKGSNFSVKTDPFPVISAAKLISEAGLRGAKTGGAQISMKHPNFIVNIAGARATDVKRLIARAKKSVWKKFKVQLEEEIQIL